MPARCRHKVSHEIGKSGVGGWRREEKRKIQVDDLSSKGKTEEEGEASVCALVRGGRARADGRKRTRGGDLETEGGLRDCP